MLDLTHYVAGPYATRLMATQGAEVIKVERPGSGDPARSLGPFPDGIPDEFLIVLAQAEDAADFEHDDPRVRRA